MDQTRSLIAVLDDEPQFCKTLARRLKTHDFDAVAFTAAGTLRNSGPPIEEPNEEVR